MMAYKEIISFKNEKASRPYALVLARKDSQPSNRGGYDIHTQRSLRSLLAMVLLCLVRKQSD